jgi:hypothetical protein
MNLLVIRRTVVLILTGLIFTNAAAGKPSLTKRDKSQIIQFILRTYDFTQSDTWRDNGENTVLLLNGTVSPADIPSRPGVNFTFVKQAELDRLRNAGVEFYEFSPFKRTRSGVTTALVRTFRSATEGNGSVVEYTCRKVGGRWKLKARLDGVYAS